MTDRNPSLFPDEAVVEIDGPVEAIAERQNFLCHDGAGEVPSQIHSYLASNFKELRGPEKNDPPLQAKAKGRWYVPDPRKAADLEKLRDRALFKEFDEYLTRSGEA